MMFSLEDIINITEREIMRKLNKGKSSLMSEWMESSCQCEVVKKLLLLNQNSFFIYICTLSGHPIHVPAPRVSHWWCELPCVNVLNTFLNATTYSCFVFVQPHPVVLFICFQTCGSAACELHYYTWLKRVISILRSPFFLLLKWVYYGFIFHCLSNRCCLLSEGFCVLPSHSGWVDCQMLQLSAELHMNAREVSGSASAIGREIKVCWERWDMG